jgi:serine O-acetyltransferase
MSREQLRYGNPARAKRLLESYDSDKDPFIKDTTVRFPERPNGFREVRLIKELFFPNYWNSGQITSPEGSAELEKKVDELGQLFFDGSRPYLRDLPEKDIHEIVRSALDQLPDIREKLKKDVEAAYAGDPAAGSYTVIVRAYPGLRALEVYRVLHVLYELGAKGYARELTEHVHDKGIDINPGAKIGEYCFIDHGTGLVIGETAEIGDWFRVYQGVTLGVLHFEKEDGEQTVLRKGYKRHPTIGDHVVIGAGAKVLGPVTIGDHVNIGANAWVAEDIPDHYTVYVAEHPKLERRQRKRESMEAV